MTEFNKTDKTSSSSLKLPRVEFDGTNFTEWQTSLENEAAGNGLGGFLKEKVTEKLRVLPSVEDLMLSSLSGTVLNKTEHHLHVNFMTKSDQCLALVKSTLRKDFRNQERKEEFTGSF